MKYIVFLFLSIFMLGGCVATKSTGRTLGHRIKDFNESKQFIPKLPKKKKYKRKIIIGRFSNATNYGKLLLSSSEYSKIAQQASDILSSYLTKTNRYIVLERFDIDIIKEEQRSIEEAEFVGADTVIVGSITEFGRAITGKKGFLSQTKIQTANASVELRLVDVSTGRIFFSATGKGNAVTETGSVAGFGSVAAYDGSLNDKAISAAITNVIEKMIVNLEERPWKTDILDIQGNKVYISGGKYQGLKIDDNLSVMNKNKAVKSEQSGFEIDLPPEKVAEIEVVELFGEDEINEGSVCVVTAGNLYNYDIKNLYVVEEV
jgi:curli biogenesis system outer membrane secretion channel CsgG